MGGRSRIDACPAVSRPLAQASDAVTAIPLKREGRVPVRPRLVARHRPARAASARRLQEVLQVLDHGADDIGAADDAHQDAVTQDQHALDLLLQHDVAQFGQ